MHFLSLLILGYFLYLFITFLVKEGVKSALQEINQDKDLLSLRKEVFGNRTPVEYAIDRLLEQQVNGRGDRKFREKFIEEMRGLGFSLAAAATLYNSALQRLRNTK